MTRAERWFWSQLCSRTQEKWTYQAVWGWRVYDFWCAELGVAIEVDGPEQDISKDRKRDAYNWKRSAIHVFRVPNFNQGRADTILFLVNSLDGWLHRRRRHGLLTKAQQHSVYT